MTPRPRITYVPEMSESVRGKDAKPAPIYVMVDHPYGIVDSDPIIGMFHVEQRIAEACAVHDATEDLRANLYPTLFQTFVWWAAVGVWAYVLSELTLWGLHALGAV